MSLRESIDAALNVAAPDPRDQGTVELALTYADDIEHGGDLAKLGPALLAALEALQLSPRSRKVTTADDKSAGRALDELRERRRSRADRAADMDATAS